MQQETADELLGWDRRHVLFVRMQPGMRRRQLPLVRRARQGHLLRAAAAAIADGDIAAEAPNS